MSYFEPYKPNERIVDRAVALWLRMLANPKYDTLGSTRGNPQADPNGTVAIGEAMAHMIPKNNTPDVLERFGVVLKKALMTPNERGEFGHDQQCLSVDYGPDKILVDAAEEAGLKMQFPWKTTMHIAATHLCVRYGYGAPYVYHYPLSDNRWLMTTLHGTEQDNQVLVALAESGAGGLQVESAVAA